MLSAVIPTYTTSDELKALALRCARSIRDQVDELIISEDSDVYDRDLHQISDLYLLHPRLQYAANSNLGWRAASGTHVAIVNSDCELLEGSLKDLCREHVVSPDIPMSIVAYTVSGAFFVVPRPVFERGGMFDAREYKYDNSDVELFARYKNYTRFHRELSVKVSHAIASPGPSFTRAGEYKGR